MGFEIVFIFFIGVISWAFICDRYEIDGMGTEAQ